jgi:hypothetical protein
MLPGVSYKPNYCLNKQVELLNRILTPLNDVLDQNNQIMTQYKSV